MSAHAELSPSAADRWMTCTASHKHIQGYPNKTNAAAEEGTRAHEVVEHLLRNGGVPPIHGNSKDDQYTEEMVDHGLGHYQHCHDLLSQDPAGQMWVEQKVDAPRLSEKVWGTADTIIYLPTLDELHIIDYKYGRGVTVEPTGRQLLVYAVLAMATLFPGQRPPQKVVLTIVQPRISHQDGPIRSWELPQGKLIDFAHELKGTVLDIENDRVEFVPSEKACKFCPGIRDCNAVTNLAEEAALKAFTPVDATVHTDLAVKLEIAEILKSWIKAVNAHALEVLLLGQEVPGYKAVKGRSNRAWKHDQGAIEFLRGKGFRLKDVTTPKILGIPAIEKLVAKKRNITPEEFGEHVVKPEGRATLAKADDKRPAINVDELGFTDVDGVKV